MASKTELKIASYRYNLDSCRERLQSSKCVDRYFNVSLVLDFSFIKNSTVVMAFFGVTYFGNYNALHDSQPANHTLPFGDIPDDVYEDAFDRRVMGSSGIATGLQVR